jgi:hypothetical protein
MDSRVPVIRQILSEVPGNEPELHANLSEHFQNYHILEYNIIKFEVPG